MTLREEFDTELPREGLSSMKWEYEKERTGFDDILSYGTADMDFKSPEPVRKAICRVAERDILAILMCLTAIIPPWKTGFTGPQAGRSTEDKVFPTTWTRRTKLMWICNPHNPVGRAWTKEELTEIGRLCLKHKVRILSDDVYCGLLLPGNTYTPIASLSKEISDITITCYSPSKTYNTTGIKFSYVVAENLDMMELYDEALHQLDLNYGINLFGLAVTEAAYNECDGWVRELMEYIRENLEFLKVYLAENIPDITLVESEATYFAWLDCRSLGISSDALAEELEQEAHVILGSGEGLGTGGNGYLRMNLACPKKTLLRGLERIKTFFR